jgi:hypothetical protein
MDKIKQHHNNLYYISPQQSYVIQLTHWLLPLSLAYPNLDYLYYISPQQKYVIQLTHWLLPFSLAFSKLEHLYYIFPKKLYVRKYIKLTNWRTKTHTKVTKMVKTHSLSNFIFFKPLAQQLFNNTSWKAIRSFDLTTFKSVLDS